jgi:hypothetical protein
LAVATIVIVMLLMTLQRIPPPARAYTPSTGVIVPLYFTAGSQWDGVIQAKEAYPSVPIVGIINVANGPGTASNSSYVTLTQQLESAGVVVLGYVYTSYGARNASSVESDISDYASWYNVDGVFLDQMAYQPGEEGYYSNLTSYSKSLGLTMVVGNPGVDPAPSYVGTVDTIVTYEGSGFPNPQAMAGWNSDYAKTDWAVLAYNVDTLSNACVDSESNHVGYLYVTNGVYPYPWNSLPPYFDDLVAELDSAPTDVCITMQSSVFGGGAISGLWTMIQENGSTISTGFTPVTFAASPSTSYSVSVQNFKNYSFYDWSDTGSLDTARNVSVVADTTITAVYFNYSAPPPPGYSEIYVKTVNSTGSELTGLRVSFWSTASILPGCSSPCSSGQGLLYSCFSPCAFFPENGGTDYVAAAGFEGETFGHWSDGTENEFHEVVLGNATSETDLEAVYSP